MFETIIRTPDYVDIDGAVAANNLINDGLFMKKDVTVAVRIRGEKLAVCLTAEESPVSRVRVRWHFAEKLRVQMLEDAWERAYAALEEAAYLDGASDLQIFFRIYIPLSKAVIAVIIMYYGVSWWNIWYQSLVFQPDNKLWPLQMILRETLISNDRSATMDVTSMAEEFYTRELVKYCTVIIATVPILVIYPFVQKHFVKGAMIGAVKG